MIKTRELKSGTIGGLLLASTFLVSCASTGEEGLHGCVIETMPLKDKNCNVQVLSCDNGGISVLTHTLQCGEDKDEATFSPLNPEL
ncbi:MAG: hypothetical protein R3D66_06345 [Alphaproteobacteria bacterium]